VGEERNKTCATDVLLLSGCNPALLKIVFKRRKGKIQNCSLWREWYY